MPVSVDMLLPPEEFYPVNLDPARDKKEDIKASRSNVDHYDPVDKRMLGYEEPWVAPIANLPPGCLHITAVPQNYPKKTFVTYLQLDKFDPLHKEIAKGINNLILKTNR